MARARTSLRQNDSAARSAPQLALVAPVRFNWIAQARQLTACPTRFMLSLGCWLKARLCGTYRASSAVVCCAAGRQASNAGRGPSTCGAAYSQVHHPPARMDTKQAHAYARQSGHRVRCCALCDFQNFGFALHIIESSHLTVCDYWLRHYCTQGGAAASRLLQGPLHTATVCVRICSEWGSILSAHVAAARTTRSETTRWLLLFLRLVAACAQYSCACCGKQTRALRCTLVEHQSWSTTLGRTRVVVAVVAVVIVVVVVVVVVVAVVIGRRTTQHTLNVLTLPATHRMSTPPRSMGRASTARTVTSAPACWRSRSIGNSCSRSACSAPPILWQVIRKQSARGSKDCT